VLRLGGNVVSEMSLACRTGLFDLHTRAWWPDALEFAGLSADHLAPPTLGADGAGRSTIPALEGAHLVVAGHDHQVAAFGALAIHPAALFDSLGTAEAVIRFVDAPPPPHALIEQLTSDNICVGYTVAPDRLAVLCGLRSGQTMERISKLLGHRSRDDRRAIAEQAAHLEPHTVLEVIPSRGSLTVAGITDDVEPAALWRAGAEWGDAAVGSLIDILDEVWEPATDVVIAGGWLNDPVVRQLKARRFPTFRRAPFARAGAAGAAAMAGIRAGVLEIEPGPGGDPIAGGRFIARHT
jgi:sugar (pentulose or hexulose) kinase